MRLISFAVALAALMGCAGSAMAGEETKTRSAPDPDKIICENQAELGSRLATKRVCLTRAQWDEKRRQDRALIERSQTGACERRAGC